MPTPDHEGSSNKRLMALGAFASLLVAAAGGALIYGIVLDPAVAGPITGAVGVVVAAILQRRWEKRQELERSRREQMSPIYERLVGILKESPGEEETSEFFKDLSTRMLLYGPAPIIKEWIEFRLHGMSTASDPTNPTSLLNYEKLPCSQSLVATLHDVELEMEGVAMARKRREYSLAECAELWERWKRGESYGDIARALDRVPAMIYCTIRRQGGVAPPERRRSRLALTLREREEISRGIAAGRSAGNGGLIWPHCGGLNWPHLRLICHRLFGAHGARAGGGGRNGITSGDVRADQEGSGSGGLVDQGVGGTSWCSSTGGASGVGRAVAAREEQAGQSSCAEAGAVSRTDRFLA